MKPIKLLTLAILACGAFSLSLCASAGRYDGISEVFNRAAKGMDPPQPRELNLDYRASGFDPPGLHGPDIGQPQSFDIPPPARTLTDEFNAQSLQ